MRTPTITRVEMGGRLLTASEDTSLTTQPLPEAEIDATIERVVSDSRKLRDQIFDVVTVLQIKARLAADTGERLTHAEFADQVGFDLEQLRDE